MAEIIELKKHYGVSESVDYCDKMIKEGDEIMTDFWIMVKRSLLSGESKFEEWDKRRVL